MKFYEDEKLKHFKSRKGSENIQKKKSNKIDECKDNDADIKYQNNDKLDKCKDNDESMNHNIDKIDKTEEHESDSDDDFRSD